VGPVPAQDLPAAQPVRRWPKPNACDASDPDLSGALRNGEHVVIDFAGCAAQTRPIGGTRCASTPPSSRGIGACYGSRFDVEGAVLEGQATQSLQRPDIAVLVGGHVDDPHDQSRIARRLSNLICLMSIVGFGHLVGTIR
jgi:hypothetical protein